MEAEAVSQTTSPCTHKPYGVATVARVWQVPRSTFHAMKARQGRPVAPRAKRGPKTSHFDAELTELIRKEIAASPFHGEGHRQIWARVRFQDIWTSKLNVLRLMREAPCLARLGTLLYFLLLTVLATPENRRSKLLTSKTSLFYRRILRVSKWSA